MGIFFLLENTSQSLSMNLYVHSNCTEESTTASRQFLISKPLIHIKMYIVYFFRALLGVNYVLSILFAINKFVPLKQ